MDAPTFRKLYSNLTKGHDLWNNVPSATGQVYDWPRSTYIAEPPFFDHFEMTPAPGDSIAGAGAVRPADASAAQIAERLT